MTQPRLPSMSVPGALSGALTTNPLGSGALTEKGKKAYGELWSKLRWALGTSYGLPYAKTSDCGNVARLMALHLIDANGLPDATPG